MVMGGEGSGPRAVGNKAGTETGRGTAPSNYAAFQHHTWAPPSPILSLLSLSLWFASMPPPPLLYFSTDFNITRKKQVMEAKLFFDSSPGLRF